MIKRYGLGANPEALTASSMRPSLIQIVEREDGDYVRYEDYMRIIDAIGAGGVSGRIIRKTLDEHRVEFETHWHNIQSHGLDNGWLGVAWAAWKAARGITE